MSSILPTKAPTPRIKNQRTKPEPWRSAKCVPSQPPAILAAAKGKAWLFFGEVSSKSCFFYKEEFEGCLADGTLTNAIDFGTIGAAAGVPGNSLIEIDVIAYI